MAIIAFTVTIIFTANVGYTEQLNVASAKAEGMVGEKPNGMLGIVINNPSDDIKMLVKTTNIARLERYKQIANKNGIEITKVQAMAGAKLIKEAPKGQWIFIEGKWTQK